MADKVAPYGLASLVRGGPSREELLAEAYRRGILPKDDAEAYEEGARRGLIKAPSDVHALMDANSRERGQADTRNVANGLSWGISRHVDALGAGLETGLHNLASRATGGLIKGSGYSAQEAVQAVERAQIQQDREFERQHPRRAFIEDLVGGVFAPGLGAAGAWVKGAKIARDASLATKLAAHGGRAARSSVVGGVIGGVNGATRSEQPEDVLGNTINGAGGGAALGGAIEPLASVTGAGLNRTAKAFKRGADAVRAVVGGNEHPNVVARARETAKEALRGHMDEAGVSVADLERASPHKTVAEAIGPSGVSELQTLARRPGETPKKVADLVAERRAGRDERIMGDVHHHLGIDPAAARGGIEAVVNVGRKRADPLFDELRQRPGPIWNADLAKLAERPAIKRAMGSVANNLRDAGIEPHQAGIMIDPDTGSHVIDNKGRVIQHQPRFETWENVRQALGEQVKRDERTGALAPGTHPGDANYGVFKAQDDLTKALKDAVPGYDKALSTAADYRKVETVFRRVERRGLFSSRTTPAEFDKLWGSLKTQGERMAARHALVSEIFDQSQNKTPIISRFLRPNGQPIPAVKAKLERAFGSDAAGELIAALKDHHAEIKFENQVLPSSGSHTTPMGERARRQDEDSGAAHMASMAKAAARGNLASAAAGGFLGFEASDKKNPVEMAKSTALGALGGVALRHGVRASERVGQAHRNALGEMLLSKPGELPPLEVEVPPKGYRWTPNGWASVRNALAPPGASLAPRIVSGKEAVRP